MPVFLVGILYSVCGSLQKTPAIHSKNIKLASRLKFLFYGNRLLLPTIIAYLVQINMYQVNIMLRSMGFIYSINSTTLDPEHRLFGKISYLSLEN